jgi:hypothetical protein
MRRLRTGGGHSACSSRESRRSNLADGYRITGRDGTKINRRRSILLRSPTAVFLNVSMGKGNDVLTFVGAFNTQTV